MEIKIKKLAQDLPTPHYQTEGAAGMDLYANIQEEIILWGGETIVIPTGIQIALPHMHEAQIRSRSGLAAKHGLFVLNSPGTVDEDFRNEVGVILANFGSNSVTIKRGDRIAQMVINKIEKPTVMEVDELDKTSRKGGFGSTGI